MKTRRKIWLVSGLFFLAILLALFFSRHVIASYALRSVVKSQSEGRIILDIHEIVFNPFRGTVKLIGPDLHFTDSYLNEAKSIKLNRISLSQILIDGISIFDVLANRRIFAERLILEKPVIWFEEENGKEQSSFDPDKLMASLHHKPENLTSLNIFIRNVEIHYGSINLTAELADKFAPGFVDFKLILNNFSTQLPADTTIKKVLYSDNFLFKIKNLQKVFASGYTLRIDSALFNSRIKRLTWHGVDISAFQNDSIHKQGIHLHAGLFELNDIDVRQLDKNEDFRLSSIIISNGFLFNYGARFIKKREDTLNKNGMKELFRIFHGFKLDTMWVNQFNYARVLDNYDTVFLTNDLSLMVNGIVIDSAMVDDPWQKLIISEISFRTGRAYAIQLVDNIDVNFKSVAFSSLDEKFELNSLEIIDNNLVRGSQALKLSAASILIDSISVDKFRQKQKQNIILALINPMILVSSYSLEKSGGQSGRQNTFSDLFGLKSFVIRDGKLNYLNDSLKFDVDGLNFMAEDIDFDENRKLPFQHYNLSLNLKSLLLEMNGLRNQVKTGKLFYEDNYLNISDIYTYVLTGADKKVCNIQIKEVQLKNLDLDKFSLKNDFFAYQVIMDSPIFEGKIQFSKKTETTATKSKKTVTLPFNVELGQLLVNDGEFDLDVLSEKDSMRVKSMADLELTNIKFIITDTLNTWLEQIGWKAMLSATGIESDQFKLSARQLLFDESSSLLKIKNFSFRHKSDSSETIKAFEIKDFSFLQMLISGLEYDNYLFRDTIIFSKLELAKPVLKAIIRGSDKKEDSLNQRKIDLSLLKKLDYDTVSMTGFSVDIKNIAKGSSHSFFRIRDFNLNHVNPVKSETNFFSGFVLDFRNFDFRDSLANKYISIYSGEIEPDNHRLSFNRLKVGALSKENTSDFYYISKINLTGIVLKREFPINLTIQKVGVDSLDLSINAKNQSDSVKKSNSLNLIDLNRELLGKYNNIIAKFKIDTTLLNNLRVNYYSKANDKESSINFDNIALLIDRLNFDSTSYKRNHLPIENVIINLRGKTFITGDSLYKFKTGNITYNFPKNRITIDSLFFTPRFAETEFFDRSFYQTERMILFGEKVEINDFRFQEFLDDNQIHIGNVDVFRAKAEIKRDKSYPMKPGIYKNMPQTDLRNASQVFTIDSIRIIDSYVSYTERVLKSEVPGEIFFDRFNVSAYNLTNNLLLIDSASQLSINVSAFLMGQSQINLSVYFNLLSPVDEFWFNATSGSIDLTSLNSMTENLMGMSFKEGHGDIDISKISGNYINSTGTMIFRYKRLKVTLYSRKKAQLVKGPLSPMVDFLMNDLLIKSNNPKFARSPRIGVVYFTRDTQKGIINYIFKSSLSGMTSTLGFNNKEQRQEKKN